MAQTAPPSELLPRQRFRWQRCLVCLVVYNKAGFPGESSVCLALLGPLPAAVEGYSRGDGLPAIGVTPPLLPLSFLQGAEGAGRCSGSGIPGDGGELVVLRGGTMPGWEGTRWGKVLIGVSTEDQSRAALCRLRAEGWEGSAPESPWSPGPSTERGGTKRTRALQAVKNCIGVR